MVTKKPKIRTNLSEKLRRPEDIRNREERKRKISEGLIPMKAWCKECHYLECGIPQYEGDHAKCNVGIDECYIENGDIPDWAKEGYVNIEEDIKHEDKSGQNNTNNEDNWD